MIRASGLYGRSVIDLDTAERIGEVNEIIVDPYAPGIAGYVVACERSRFGARKRIIIPIEAFHAIGPDVRAHDIRRTISTMMRAAGVDRDTVAMVLNHELQSGGAATGHYDHYTGDAEKRDALTRWDRILTGIIKEGGSESKVLSFAR